MEVEVLFSTYDLHDTLNNQKPEINKAVFAVPTENLMEAEITVLVDELYEKLKVKPLELLENEISVEQREAKVDVSRNSLLFIMDRSQPYYVNGISVSYYLPFTGDKELLKCRPNTFSSVFPRAAVSGQELIFEYQITDANTAATKAPFERDLESVKKYAGWIAEQVEQYNQSLPESIRTQLEKRRQTLTASREQIGGLGFKVRSDQPAPASNQSSTANKVKPQVVKPPKTKLKKQNNKHTGYDVALSFAGENRGYVEAVAQCLQDAGVNVFYDRFETINLWGKNLVDHLGQVYAEQSRFIVMFVSEHYAKKAWTNHERKFAQERQLNLMEDCILPVRFDDTKIPGLADSIGYIDLRHYKPNELAELIIQKLKS